eukprot:GCRY01000767.1.p1 GENE.GCRY01000767.1~~GCRY01000767.1.p1  ORF type:complete len:303 (+),score=29.44 GCRY01000767.1:163-1071(+)
MDRLSQMLAGGRPPAPKTDSAETIHISSLALLKMLKHGRAGVPMEVMGLMLGDFVDDFTIKVVDVFAMPQSGTGVSVEAVDPVFQTNMLDMLKQTGRDEMVVGWYHSHPGFGCWLSGVDQNTQQSFEQLNPRAVAVVVDPIQSVRGKVVIDGFRLIDQQFAYLHEEPRQTTSNVGQLKKHTIQALIHGLNRQYYSLNIDYRKDELEEKMLLNFNKTVWMDALSVSSAEKHDKDNSEMAQKMVSLAKAYSESIQNEKNKTEEELVVMRAGQLDPKRHLSDDVTTAMSNNIVQTLGLMIDTVAF